MNMRLVKLAAILTLGFVGLASQSFPMKSDLKPAGEPVKGDAAVAPYSAFGIDLYLRTAAADPGRNVFISPASVGLALAMAWNGSAGETQAAMAATLRLPSSEFAVVNAADSKLMAAMKAEKRDVELSVANSLWARKGIEFKKPFLARNERFYDADVRTLNFDDPSSPGVINAWVAGKTKDKIREIVDRIDASAILYLINAIYFKGSWAMEFDPKFTRDQAFHAASGEKRTRMMHRSGNFFRPGHRALLSSKRTSRPRHGSVGRANSPSARDTSPFRGSLSSTRQSWGDRSPSSAWASPSTGRGLISAA
jgi:serine protease inhibitor